MLLLLRQWRGRGRQLRGRHGRQRRWQGQLRRGALLLAVLQPGDLLSQQQLQALEEELARVDAREVAGLALAGLLLAVGGLAAVADVKLLLVFERDV